MQRELQADVIIIGGGLGGVAAAIGACRMGQRVILTEETDWLGGQLTAQGVPPDEHPWIETTGCTQTYQRLRVLIMDYYRRNYPLRPEVRQQVHLNPGLSHVSRLTCEPRAALTAINELLAPYRAAGLLHTRLLTRPIAAETDGDRVRAVTVQHLISGDQTVLHAPYIVDATETGDLLALANVEHVIGAEGRDDTGELHAPAVANPMDQQAVTWCFAMDHLPGEHHVIDKPEDYDFWRGYAADFWSGPLLSWTDVDPQTNQPRTLPVFDDGPGGAPGKPGPRWLYRRILCAAQYVDGTFRSDITMVNWPQNDYWLGPLVGVSEAERVRHLRGARQVSLSLLYWMQTEAPRGDGGAGYPGLRLRGDVFDTPDGLAKAVYVRESRRIVPEFRVTELHVGVKARGDQVGAERFGDSVGVGSYRIDLHASGSGGYAYIDIDSWPFQIPLGALLPVRVENLLPACKNIGTTHITNGCYRLHPVEWNIGEAVGALTGYCLTRGVTPREVRQDADHLRAFRRLLHDRFGFELEWPPYAYKTPRLGREMSWMIRELRRPM